jgi:hypothetical protein
MARSGKHFNPGWFVLLSSIKYSLFEQLPRYAEVGLA